MGLPFPATGEAKAGQLLALEGDGGGGVLPKNLEGFCLVSDCVCGRVGVEPWAAAHPAPQTNYDF